MDRCVELLTKEEINEAVVKKFVMTCHKLKHETDNISKIFLKDKEFIDVVGNILSIIEEIKTIREALFGSK